MLANGSMPMLSTAAQADSRLAAAGDMLSLPDDRRNLASASSSSPAAVTGTDASASPPSTTTSAGKMDESQQDKGRAASPAPPLAVAGKEEGSASRSSAEKSKLPCALDPRSNERKAATDTNNYSSCSDAKKTTMSTLPSAKLTGPRAAEVAAPNTNEQAPRSSPQASPPALPQQKKLTPPNVPKPAKSDSSLVADKDSATTSVPKAKTTETGETSMPSLPPAAAPATAGSDAAAKDLAPARKATDGDTAPAPSENGNGAREKKTGPTEGKAQSVKPVASQHDDDTSNNNNNNNHSGPVGMAVDEDEQQEKVPEARGVTPPSTPSSMAANTILISSAPARDCVEPRGKGASAAAPAVAAHEVEVCRTREERDGGQEGYQEQQGGAAGSAAASGDAVVKMELAEREEGVRHGGQKKVRVPHALVLQ